MRTLDSHWRPEPFENDGNDDVVLLAVDRVRGYPGELQGHRQYPGSVALIKRIKEIVLLFCSTCLPLARTRSTFSSHCPLSSNQCRWLTSAISVIFPLKFFWECRESNPWLMGEKQLCNLCAMQPIQKSFALLLQWPSFVSRIWLC